METNLHTYNVTPSQQINDHVSRLTNMSPDKYMNMADLPEH